MPGTTATIPKYASLVNTRGYSVQAVPMYLPKESDPSSDKFIFRYEITIRNETGEAAQLVARRWTITDSDGDKSLVEGPGVCGVQPTFMPGDVHKYSSFCPLTTPWGTMDGAFKMLTAQGESFEIIVGRFYLVAPQRP